MSKRNNTAVNVATRRGTGWHSR